MLSFENPSLSGRKHTEKEKKDMKRSNNFTLVELLVFFSVVLILMTLLLPALGKAREKAMTISCINNLSQIGKCWAMYLSQYDDNTPLNSDEMTSGTDIYACWQDLLYFQMGKFPVQKQKIAYYTENDAERKGEIIRLRAPFACPAQKILNRGKRTLSPQQVLQRRQRQQSGTVRNMELEYR